MLSGLNWFGELKSEGPNLIFLVGGVEGSPDGKSPNLYPGEANAIIVASV